MTMKMKMTRDVGLYEFALLAHTGLQAASDYEYHGRPVMLGSDWSCWSLVAFLIMRYPVHSVLDLSDV